jgi:hypothetical protein
MHLFQLGHRDFCDLLKEKSFQIIVRKEVLMKGWKNNNQGQKNDTQGALHAPVSPCTHWNGQLAFLGHWPAIRTMKFTRQRVPSSKQQDQSVAYPLFQHDFSQQRIALGTTAELALLDWLNRLFHPLYPSRLVCYIASLNVHATL